MSPLILSSDPAAWGVAITAMLSALTTGVVSIIVAIKTNGKLEEGEKKLDTVAATSGEIHTAVNSNYKEMQEKLDAALAELKNVKEQYLAIARDRITDLENQLGGKS